MTETPEHDRILDVTDEWDRARLKALTRVAEALRELRYGRVVVTVQDGRPVLVEVVEQEKIA